MTRKKGKKEEKAEGKDEGKEMQVKGENQERWDRGEQREMRA